MAKDLVKEVQHRLGLAPLEKVDPNDQSKNTDGNQLSDPVTQGSVMGALIALYKITRGTENTDKFLLSGKGSEWIELLYSNGLDALVTAIVPDGAADEVRSHSQRLIQQTAETAQSILYEVLGDKLSSENVKSYMSGQRNTLLQYLPGGQKLGELLNDAMLEDRTMKMRGPVSSMAHGIEQMFSETD